MYGNKMYINDIVDAKLLEEHIRNGYVTSRTHPHLPLTILNYTPKAAYEPLWDEVTLRTRGLIVDNSGVIVGNCMNKFFNYGELIVKNMDLSGPVQVTDKLDGSMGSVIVYRNQLVVATRGSFESEQAQWAQNFIEQDKELYNAFKALCSGNVTAVVEIIYPENRIVVDYGNLQAVVLIGAIANYELARGKQLWTPADKIYSWPGPVVEKFNADSFEEALRIPPRINREGIVIYFERSGARLKIKQQDYLIAHKFVSNLTPKNIWQQLCSGKTVEQMLEIAPDEFHETVREISSRILNNKQALREQVEQEFISLNPAQFETRRDFAEAIKDHPLKSFLFLRLDNKEAQLLDSIWKAIEP